MKVGDYVRTEGGHIDKIIKISDELKSGRTIITIYELLGMVKDGKDLPKKIKYGNNIYVLQENLEDYATWLYDNLDLLNDVILGHFNIEDAIYLEIEILEEKKKIPGKLNLDTYATIGTEVDRDVIIKINEIIDYFKSKGE